jgi:uncharacterized protein
MDRRSFLSQFSVFTGSLVLACNSLGRRADVLAQTGDLSAHRAVGYGDLVPTLTKNTGESFLALPKGFEYNVIGRTGSKMSDERLTPPRHDGMATFRVNKELRVVRNHEVTGGRVPRPGSAIASGPSYDEAAGGGTTTLVIDPSKREILRDFVSLSGTLVNCCGGPTPWGSWITCEETTIGQSIRTSATGVKTGGFAKPHGYCFEVPAASNGPVAPVPLKAMGRFEHEAIAVDRRSGVVYLTEDFATCGFYRFLPIKNKRLAEGGVLQMLAVKGQPGYDTRKGQKMRSQLPATWVTIKDPDPPETDLDTLAVYKQGKAAGGATFARLEGCCADETGNIYFTATSGGDSRGGQIWRYEPNGKHDGMLTLLFESPSRSLLDMPDNLCVRPKSDHLFVCEDSDYVGAGATPENMMRILTPDGRIADFAKNIAPKFETTEFAGSTFSPDGKTLFVNLQVVGVTLAIWGDWAAFRA